MGKYLVLFGAGASYGCGAVRHISYDKSNKKVSYINGAPAPPLGNQLIGELTRFEPDVWLPVEGFFVDKNFERAWENLAEHLGGNRRNLTKYQKSMAKFFFRFLPDPGDLNSINYYLFFAGILRRFADLLRKPWNGAIATLNYDAMVQVALRQCKVPFFIDWYQWKYDDLEKRIELCVPHGYSWLYEEIMDESILDEVDGSDFFSHQIDGIDDFYDKIESYKHIPLMSYYHPKKENYFGEEFIQNQRERFDALVAQAEHIVIIGVSYNANDHHIWGPLARTGAHIHFVEPHDASQFNAWAQDGNVNKSMTNDYDIIQGAFKDSFWRICAICGIPVEALRV